MQHISGFEEGEWSEDDINESFPLGAWLEYNGDVGRYSYTPIRIGEDFIDPMVAMLDFTTTTPGDVPGLIRARHDRMHS